MNRPRIRLKRILIALLLCLIPVALSEASWFSVKADWFTSTIGPNAAMSYSTIIDVGACSHLTLYAEGTGDSMRFYRDGTRDGVRFWTIDSLTVDSNGTYKVLTTWDLIKDLATGANHTQATDGCMIPKMRLRFNCIDKTSSVDSLRIQLWCRE